MFLGRKNGTFEILEFHTSQYDFNNNSPKFLDTPKRYCPPNFNSHTMMFPEPISFSDLNNPSISPIRSSPFCPRKCSTKKRTLKKKKKKCKKRKRLSYNQHSRKNIEKMHNVLRK